MAKKPKPEEKHVMNSLILQGYENIEYEPDGESPPDILINGKIAIEVRRLNQNRVVGNDFRGLEQDEYAISGMIRKIMDDVSDDDHDKSAFVSYFFYRPISEKKELKKKITEILKKHKAYLHEKREYKISENFSLRISPSSLKLKKQYQYGMSSDGDTGGFVVSSIYENLQLAIKEKEEKIKEIRHKYSEWWLALVDMIGYGLTDLDMKHFYELPQLNYNFDRILLVSSLDTASFTYLYE